MTVQEPDVHTRGVENPRVVDLIFSDDDQDQVVLQMIEPRPWCFGPEQLAQLEEKLNNYLDYTVDGWLSKQYPQYDGRRVRIQLCCAQLPTDLVARMLEEVQSYLATQDIAFEVKVGLEPSPMLN